MFHIIINVIDPKFQNASIWKRINSVYKAKGSKWSPAKKIFGIKNRANEDYMLFILYISELYREYLYQIVINQEFKKIWIPLSPDYLKRKIKEGYPENMWFRTGELLDAIEIKYQKGQSRIKIGIDERRTTKVGKTTVKLILIAKWLEYGTKKLPARPLFRPAKDYISRHIRRYADNFYELIEPIS